jgi:uncharacterized membrane protein
MLEQSRLWIEHLAAGVEIAAAVIIGLAAAEAVWKALPLFLRRGLSQGIKVEVRLSLGRWLALGLEFALAADILRTAVAPTWRDIGQFAADRRASYWTKLFRGTGDCTRRRQVPHLCSPGQFRLASSMCFGIASDHVFFTLLL